MPAARRATLACLTTVLTVAPAALGAQVTTPAPAGPRDVATNTDAWFVYAGDYALAGRWALLAEAEARRADGLARWQQFLLRPALAYALAPGVRVTVGYEFQETWPYGAQPAPARSAAHHLWEQVQLGHATGRVAWQHRYRLEQRWVAVPLDTTTQDRRYTNRVRYQARATVPLRGHMVDVGAPYLSAYDEVFVSWGRNVGRNVFDQNRAAAVLGWRLAAGTRLETGYMQQLLFKGDGVHVERNHTLLVTLAQSVRARR